VNKITSIATIFLLLIASIQPCIAQKRGAVWCFGDSALVDFSDTSNIVTGYSSVKSRGSCASISDTTGNLLFYVSYDPTVMISGTDPLKIYGANNNVILNGDSLKGGGWYNEISILPFPGSDSLYYIYYIGVTLDTGIYYSVVDLSANGGMGEVIQKNVQLQSFKMVGCLNTVKHGNGRDWWVIFRRFQGLSTGNNDFHMYLITPSGISNLIIQSVGSINKTNIGQIAFNGEGSQMSYINYKGLLELYDFNRCSGLISNPITISPESTSGALPERWSVEFSPSSQLLYVSHIAGFGSGTCYLVQYDLTAGNISLSADTIWTTTEMINMGQLKKGPDNKIYLATNYYGGYIYPDTTYNYINMNLSVINYPDSLGASCDIQPHSFSLGGSRCYFGLPNNPDYDLGPITGSICDTLVSVSEITSKKSNLLLYYDTGWETLFVNAQNLRGRTYMLYIYDMFGHVVSKEEGQLTPPYFTKDVRLPGIAKGMYIVRLVTDKERLAGKVLVR
jgi:hypothetical protein